VKIFLTMALIVGVKATIPLPKLIVALGTVTDLVDTLLYLVVTV
jgi:hypothetical protein